MDSPAASQRNERRALIYALIAIALWSTIATGFKLGLREFTPGQLVLAGAIASTLFFAIVHLFGRSRAPHKPVAPLTRRQVAAAAVLGLLNPFVYYFVLLEAYDRLPAQIAQPLNYTWAITMAVLAIPVLKQRLDPRAWGGVGLGYVGVVILLTQGDFTSFDRFDSLGIFLAVLSTLIWASYWLLGRRWLGDIDPARTLIVGFSVALLPIAVAVALTDGMPTFSMRLVGFAIWVGLLEMGVAFLLWQRALQLTERAGALAQLIFLSPLASLVLIGSVLGEDIHLSAVVALAAILAGLFLTQRR